MMILSALLTAAVASVADVENLSPDMTAFTNDASGWVLEGKALPVDYRQRLQKMTPADRLLAITFLRRSGLLKEDIWALDDVLRDAIATDKAAE